MSEQPFIKFYPSDFLAGTSGLSPAERGVYITILCLIYEADGEIARDDARLSRRCGAPKAGFVRIIEALIDQGKLIERGGMLSNRRAEKAIVDRQNRSRKAYHAASQKWSAQEQKTETNQRAFDANASRKQCLGDASQNQNQSIKERDANASLKKVDAGQDPFEDFWQAYPHRGGAKKGKAVARKAWTRATTRTVDRTDPAEIIAAARAYHADRQVRSGYAKDPATWINQACWLDEIEMEDKPNATKRNSTDGQAHERAQRIAARVAARLQ